MDLGCIDMGCIEKQSEEALLDSENSTNGSGHSNSKNRKMQDKGLTSQMRKNPLRKSSPMNWFPRKKVDSFLKRKIKQLQEVGGMNSTLDETLGDSNPHYSRVLREKIAVSEAAHKAMEARKAAMVEASWCRILRAARIQSKDAEALLLEAEKTAAEAFEAAASIGVIMYDKPDCPRKDYEIDTSEKFTAALTVTASFETAFEVDKQVAAAVKSAFVKLASCPSINKEEFKELLRKISEHPDIDEGNQDLSELSSECESDAAAEFDPGFHRDSSSSQDLSLNYEKAVGEVRERKYKKKQPFQKFNTTMLVDMMLERLRCLQEDELASLAIIVATCGLNATLAEAENFKQPDLGSASDYTSARALRRISSVGGGTRKQFEAELPSLDKFLVKRLTKLEREVLEAKNAKTKDKEIGEMEGNIPNTCETRALKLERSRTHNGVMRNMKQDAMDIPSLDKFLVKHVSKLERAVQEAKSRRDFEATEGAVKVSDFNKKSTLVTPTHIVDERTAPSCCDRERMGKENIDLNQKGDGGLATMKKESSIISKIEKPGEPLIHMQTILEAPETVSLQDGKNESNVIGNSLEKEKLGVSDDGIHRYQKKYGGTTSVGDFKSLDKVLVKHVSKLEKEKMAVGSKEELVRVKKRRDPNKLSDANEGSLDQILVKHKSRLEKEKIAAAQQPDDRMTHFVSRREARDREMQEAWGGIALANSMRPHISGLERDKLKRKDPNSESEDTRLDQILVKHTSRLEKEKIAAAQQPDDWMTHFVSRREARAREMQEAWGGIGLGNSMRPHISRLERDKLKRTDPNGESEDTSVDQILHISGLEGDKLKRMDPNIESEDTSLDQKLHVSGLGRDKLKRMDPNRESEDTSVDQILHISGLEGDKLKRMDPNIESEDTSLDQNSHISGLGRDKLKRMDPNKESEDTSLDQKLHVSGLGRDKLKRMDPNRESEDTSLNQNLHISGLGRDKLKRMDPNRESEDTSLDQNLHISGLGQDKLKRMDPNKESEDTSLDQILVKHTSRLEKEKIAAAAQQPDDQIRHSVSRREARERELQQAWGGLSFGNSLHPHVSRLERDKAAWLKAEEEERRKAMEL